MAARGDELRWRWFGLACLELTLAGQTVIIDPCFSRFPFRRVLMGGIQPGASPISVVNCQGILVTHSHWDHVLDAASLAKTSRGKIFGSPNTAGLMRLSDVPEVQLQVVNPGDRFLTGKFRVEALSGEHEHVPFFGAGPLAPGLQLPLRAREYRLDTYLCYLIGAGDIRILTDPGIKPQTLPEADVLFIQPHRPEDYYLSTLAAVKPRLVVPIHWDSLFRFSRRPPHAYWRSKQGWPPVKRVSLTDFSTMVKRLSPGTEVTIPELSVDYLLR